MFIMNAKEKTHIIVALENMHVTEERWIASHMQKMGAFFRKNIDEKTGMQFVPKPDWYAVEKEKESKRAKEMASILRKAKTKEDKIAMVPEAGRERTKDGSDVELRPGMGPSLGQSGTSSKRAFGPTSAFLTSVRPTERAPAALPSMTLSFVKKQV